VPVAGDRAAALCTGRSTDVAPADSSQATLRDGQQLDKSDQVAASKATQVDQAGQADTDHDPAEQTQEGEEGEGTVSLSDLPEDVLLRVLCYAANPSKSLRPWSVCKHWRQLLAPDPALAQFLAAGQGPENALTRAAAAGKEGTCRWLLQSGGAEVEDGKCAALHGAVCKGHLGVVQLLLAHRSWVEEGKALTWALCLAAGYGMLHICEALIAAGPPQMSGFQDSAALHWAAGHGHAAVCRLLLQSGAQAAAKDSWSLQVAAQRGEDASLEVCALLLAHGASASARCSRALQWAVKCGRLALCELLLQHGARAQSVDTAVLLDGVKKGGEAAQAARLVLGVCESARLGVHAGGRRSG